MENATQSDDPSNDLIVYLGLGSNLGDREANLREAVDRIKWLGVEVARQSSIYETEPVGLKDQPWFLNQVIEARVNRDADFGEAMINVDELAESDFASGLLVYEFHKALQRIELEMGRERSIPNGPRLIDIDLLVAGEQKGFWAETYGDDIAQVAGSPFLTLPHPRMHERRFVLEPLRELAPELRHPVFNKTCGEILKNLIDSSIVRLYRRD